MMMDPADEMAAQIEASLRMSGVAVAGSDAALRKFDERFPALKDLQPASFQPTPVEDLHSSQRTSDQQIRVEDSPSLALGIDHQLDDERWARRAIFNRLLAIENEVKNRSSRGFAAYLVAMCIGVAAALAWQSYDLAALRQISAGQDQMAGEITKLQSADMKVLAKIPSPPAQPPGPSIDPAQVRQLEQDLAALGQTVERNFAALRQSVDQISAGQDKMAGDITKLELLAKIPSPPAQAARARKPRPTAPQSLWTLIPSHP